MLMDMRALSLATEAFTEHPAMDVAVSHAVLTAVARGEMGSLFRLHVPGRVLAFGRADRVQPGYPQAVRAARAHGFAPVERLAGGRAAVFHESTLAFSWAIPDREPRARIRERYEIISDVILSALRQLGIDASTGELPGEYCPGEWSINLAGRVKVMGVGQRLVRGAAHLGGVIVVDGAEEIRNVLIPVYRALELDWDPRTAGSLADRSPGLTNEGVAEALATELSERYHVEKAPIPAHVIEAAMTIRPEHLPKVA